MPPYFTLALRTPSQNTQQTVNYHGLHPRPYLPENPTPRQTIVLPILVLLHIFGPFPLIIRTLSLNTRRL